MLCIFKSQRSWIHTGPSTSAVSALPWNTLTGARLASLSTTGSAVARQRNDVIGTSISVSSSRATPTNDWWDDDTRRKHVGNNDVKTRTGNSSEQLTFGVGEGARLWLQHGRTALQTVRCRRRVETELSFLRSSSCIQRKTLNDVITSLRSSTEHNLLSSLSCSAIVPPRYWQQPWRAVGEDAADRSSSSPWRRSRWRCCCRSDSSFIAFHVDVPRVPTSTTIYTCWRQHRNISIQYTVSCIVN